MTDRRVPARWRLALVALAIVIVATLVWISVDRLSAASGGPLELSGDTIVHDPALIVGEPGQNWYVFSTGQPGVGDGNIQIRSSPDGREWSYEGEVWAQKPEWLLEAIPGVDNLWAPELVQHDGTWYLYYAASTFGSNRSLIALATNTTLDPAAEGYEWVDQGIVMESVASDNFNAIDAGVIVDAGGTPWMSFGSFWGGLQLVELEWPSGMRADGKQPQNIAARLESPNAIEAPYIVYHDGYYYLYFSRDSCCQGLASTYNIAVGRSPEVDGVYVDRNDEPLLLDGGTPLLATSGDRVGPGGQSISGDYLAYHFYNAGNGGSPTLELRRLIWDAEGWPVIPDG